MLMIADASVDTQDLTGSSPLHEAASQWSAAYVTELLRRGARVGIRDQYGETPLFGAVQNHRDQTVVTVMLQYGSDPNVRNSIGQCPLDVALPEIRQSLTFVQNKRDRYDFLFFGGKNWNFFNFLCSIVYERKENWFYQSKPSSSSLGMGMGDNRFLFNEEMSKKSIYFYFFFNFFLIFYYFYHFFSFFLFIILYLLLNLKIMNYFILFYFIIFLLFTIFEIF